jgi:hypothetical protein
MCGSSPSYQAPANPEAEQQAADADSAKAANRAIANKKRRYAGNALLGASGFDGVANALMQSASGQSSRQTLG